MSGQPDCLPPVMERRGHTPGHICVVVPCAEHQLNSCFCFDANTVHATRLRFLETFVDSPAMVIPAHFPTPTAGWIRSYDRSFRFDFDRLL